MKAAYKLILVTILLYAFNPAAFAADTPADSDIDGIPDATEAWLIKNNPGLVDDAGSPQPVDPETTNVYTDTDSDGILDIIEREITYTSISVDDSVVCVGSGSPDNLTGQWDVRIASNLGNPVDFLTDRLAAISICHTGSGITSYIAGMGYADINTYNSGAYYAEWWAEGLIINGDYSFTGGKYLGPWLDNGTINFGSGPVPLRADLRHVLADTDKDNLDGIYGTQIKGLDDNDNALDYPFNPGSDSVQVAQGSLTLDTLTLGYLNFYEHGGFVDPGYYVPSVGAFFQRIVDTYMTDLDGVGDDNDLEIETIEISGLYTDIPSSEVGGMVRGEVDFDYSAHYNYNDIDLTYDETESEAGDFYGKAQVPQAEAITLNLPDTACVSPPCYQTV